jgi:uncharacterized protein (TIGR02996 family)
MNEEIALLRAICDNPEDDTPRLVFADWLSEQGGAVNAAWANGIRAQIWLARGATDESLLFQTCLFDSNFGQRKLRERLEMSSELVTGWERGFPSEASGYFQELCDVWPGLAFRIPIRKLHVYEVTADAAAEFVTWPALAGLRELVFGAAWELQEPSDVIPLLVACADLKGLVTLEVHGARLTDSNVTAVLDSPHLAGLKTCNLRYGYGADSLSPTVRDRFHARFGPDAFIDADIPF